MVQKRSSKKHRALWSALLVLPLMDLPSGLPGRNIDEISKRILEIIRKLKNNTNFPGPKIDVLAKKIQSGDFSDLDISKLLRKDK